MEEQKISKDFFVQSSGNARKKKRWITKRDGNQERDMKQNENRKIIYSNVDDMVSKLDEIAVVTLENKPQILCLAETKLHNKITNEVLTVGEYSIWRKDRVEKYGGGLMILTHMG